MSIMKNSTPVLLVALSAVIVATASCERGSAKPLEAQKHAPAPGYRPGSDGAGQFLESIGTATIAVLPTAIWSTEATIFLPASQQQIVQFIEENNLGAASNADSETYKSAVEDESQGQWGVFQSGLKQVCRRALDTKKAEGYCLFLELMEFSPKPGELAIGGIQCYVVDRNGENAFSFLLNSHHGAFNDAKLITRDTSEEGRARLHSAGTGLALTALRSQINSARGAGVPSGMNPTQRQEAANILNFPQDRSLGRLRMYEYGSLTIHEEARGNVSVPPGKQVTLFVSADALDDLSPLAHLDADALHYLNL